MTAKRIEAMLRPGSVAVIGASDRPGSLGEILCRNLREGGFSGPVFYVNPRHQLIDGLPVYPGVRDLPQPVDLAIIAAPAAQLRAVLDDCGARGVRGAVIVSADFPPGNGQGPTLETPLGQVARKSGLRLLGPSSFGVIRTDIRLNAACGSELPVAGRLALVSQSSALCAATLDWARAQRVGFSTMISMGVGDDAGFGDVLDFLARDGATDGIMLYMEGVGDARRLMSALRAAARVKPVVVMKAGRSQDARDSRAFHTGSLVGGDDVFDAAMRRAGVLRIREFSQLFSAASTLGTGVRVHGRRIGILTNAGGPGRLAADRTAHRWLQLARLDDATLVKLADLLPGGAVEGNPVHVQSDASAQCFAAVARLVLQDPQVDALLVILTPFAMTDAELFATELLDVALAQRKPVFTCWMGGSAVTAARQCFAASGIPTFRTPEAAVDAIAGLALFTANQQQLLQVPAPLSPTASPDRGAAQGLLEAAQAAGDEWLNPVDSKALLASFGIPIIRGRTARSAAQAMQVAASIGFPVAMKILSPDIPHKAVVGGVRLGCADARSVREGYEGMQRDVAAVRPQARLEGVLIEPMYPEQHGREFMIGVVRDPVFGPAITFGLGGTLVEVIGDRAVALPPLNPYLAQDLIRRTRASRALQPPYGAPAEAEGMIEDMLLRVSELVCELPDVGAIDINPLIVTEHGAVVVDARIGVMPKSLPQGPYRHMAVHPYPSALESALLLPDGQAATIRAIRPEDAELERDFVHRLSEQSRFLRFMFGLQDLTPTMLSKFTQVDYDRELALIVVVRLPEGREQQIGVARYITLPDEESCEFAIVLSDEWQGRGVARQLFRRLIDVARQRGLKLMTGITLRENTRMIDLARSFGFETGADADEPDLVRMTLAL